MKKMKENFLRYHLKSYSPKVWKTCLIMIKVIALNSHCWTKRQQITEQWQIYEHFLFQSILLCINGTGCHEYYEIKM